MVTITLPDGSNRKFDGPVTGAELAADIVDKGIVLTGGGALLGNMDFVLRHATGLPVSLADDPMTCVVLGTGRALEEMKRLKDVLSTMY